MASLAESHCGYKKYFYPIILGELSDFRYVVALAAAYRILQ